MAVAGGIVAGAVWALAREAAAHRAATAAMRTEWRVIEGVAGCRPLRLRARFRTRSGGELPPLVLVPGYGVGSGYLVPLAARLAVTADVFVPELPGHGRSDHDVRPLGIAELATALERWMDAGGLRAAVLVGHSLGCQIAVELAGRRSDLAAGLVLVGPTADPRARTAPQQIIRTLLASMFDRPAYLAVALRDYARAGRAVLAEDMRQMVRFRTEAALPLLVAPVRVVRGGRDHLVPSDWATVVARCAAAPPPRAIPGWGHAVHYDDPAGVADVVLRFVRDLQSRRAEGGSGEWGGEPR